MAFTSLAFIGFVLIVLALYYLVPKKFQWALLLLASFAFYVQAGWSSLVWLAAVIGVTYGAGRALGVKNQAKAATPKTDKETLKAIKASKQRIVLVALVLCFGLLFYMKYFQFTLSVVGLSWDSLDIIVPLGLSFFLFQAVGYVIDVYRGKYEPQKNIAKYALFVSFFPQMIQGPIGRYDQMSTTLLAPHKLEAKHLQYGIQLAMWGYFKKLVIADRCAVLADAVLVENTPYGGAIIVVAVLAYCIQLYCDFSGGIDITRGVAKMFGIDMAQNFKQPIFATSVADYWRRWHISLGAWMRDYLFYPISLSKPFGRMGRWGRTYLKGRLGKMLATTAATFIVYFAVGAWHGASFRYVAFGFYNGFLISLSYLLEPQFQQWKGKLGIGEGNVLWRAFQMVRTWCFVFVGRYITRAPRLLVALALMKKTVFSIQPSQLLNGTLFTFSLTKLDYLAVAVGMGILLVVEWYNEFRGNVQERLAQQHWAIQQMAILVPLAMILVFGIFQQSDLGDVFIYGQY